MPTAKTRARRWAGGPLTAHLPETRTTAAPVYRWTLRYQGQDLAVSPTYSRRDAAKRGLQRFLLAVRTGRVELAPTGARL